MKVDAKAVTAGLAGVFAGGAVAFFGAGPALFADGEFSARVAVFAVTAALYLILGAGLGALSPATWKWSGIALALPLLPVVVLFGDDAWSNARLAVLTLGFLVGDSAAALGGALIGARLRHVKRA